MMQVFLSSLQYVNGSKEKYSFKMEVETMLVSAYLITTSCIFLFILQFLVAFILKMNKLASLACAARLAETLYPPEAPFGRLGSH